MSAMPSNDFDKMSLSEKISDVDRRLGNPKGRVKSPYDLLSAIGKELFLVVNPFRQPPISDCLSLYWRVGRVCDHYGNDLPSDGILKFDSRERYVCHNFDNDEHILSLKDFNVIPNDYNNHAIFLTEEDRINYISYQSKHPDSDPYIAGLINNHNSGNIVEYFFTQEDATRLIDRERNQGLIK